MKTIVKDRVSLMVFPDDTPITMGETIVIGESGRYRIGNKANDHVVYENVTPPENYLGKRFCYNGTEWTKNLNWRGEKLWATIKR